MSSASTTPFPGISGCLHVTSKKRGRPPKSILKSSVFVAVFEGRESASGRLGVAAWNSATTDFYLFNFVDSSYSSLLTLLQELGPKEVIVDESTTTALQDAVGSASAEAAVFKVKKKFFADGMKAYRKLSSCKTELADPHLKAECLSAFAALVKYSEHARKSAFTRSSCTISIQERSLSIECPLCQKDGEKTVLSSVKEVQEHFFHYHWQVHGYACHFCGTTFPNKDDLKNGHSECKEWTAWRESRNQLDTTLRMRFARQLLCCSDCGWHAALDSRNEATTDETKMREQRIREESTMKYLQSFFMNHNNDRLLSMIVYFPADPRGKVKSIKMSVTSMAGGDPLAPCAHCGPSVTFRDPSEANEHYTKEHADKALVCEVCDARTTTQYLLKQHKMSHINDNSSYFADYLSNTARVFPPPTNLSHAPRCGWKFGLNGERAVGGVIGGIGKGFDLVGPLEDVREEKTRLMMERKRRGRYVNERGYEKATIEEEEEDWAKEVREKLLRDYGQCEFVAGLAGGAWLRESEALKFLDWINYWESEEGRTKGGPPREIEVDLSSSLVLVPTVEVELQLNDLVNPINGFALNDNVYYCHECHSIHKGKQANEHLESPGQQQQSNKCAEATQGIETNPVMNENMFQLYSLAAAPPSFRLPCPHCPVWSCSITGLRVHSMVVHGIFVGCTPIANEILPDPLAFKVDIRVAPEEVTKRGTKRRRESGGTEDDRVKREKTKKNEGGAAPSWMTGRRMTGSNRGKRTGERISEEDAKRLADEEEAKKKAEEEAMKERLKKRQEPIVIDDDDDDVVVLKARSFNKIGARFPVQSRGNTMMADENRPLFVNQRVVVGTPATGAARVPPVVASSGSRLGAAASSSSTTFNSLLQARQRFHVGLMAVGQKFLQRTTTMSSVVKSRKTITLVRSITLPVSGLPSARSTQGAIMGNVPMQPTVSVTRGGGGGTAMRGQGSQLITPARAETMIAPGALSKMTNSFNAPTMKSGSALSQLNASHNMNGGGAGSSSAVRPRLVLTRTLSQESTTSVAKKPFLSLPPPIITLD